MSFLNTEPAAIQTLGQADAWARFRVGDPRRRSQTMSQLCQGDVPVTLGMPGKASLLASLWSVDESQRRLHFNSNAEPSAVRAIQGQAELWVSAYLEDTKVQALLGRLHADVRGGSLSLWCDGPYDLYLLPRRRSVRVRQSAGEAPVVLLPPPDGAGARLEVALADLSSTGCALHLPQGQVQPRPGQVIEGVQFDLDELTVIFADIRVQHATRSPAPARTVRVGCTWQHMSHEAREVLNRWIRSGRRRHQMLSLDLD